MIMNNAEKLYQELKKQNLILFEGIVGSQAYGTATPESDVDKKFIYVLPPQYIFGLKYVEQININKDYVGYEIKRFLELVESNNPTLLELLYLPKEMILYQHPAFEIILKHRSEFITKICKNSFGGYARQQIQKAKGQNKMMNWEKEKIKRKTPIDFCFVINDNGSYPLRKFLKDKDQKFCGLVKIPNARDLYGLYYDYDADKCFNEKKYSKQERELNKQQLIKQGKPLGLGYKGITKIDENDQEISNELRLSSIPKNAKLECYISYNQDGYISHCKDYKKYQVWIQNRNQQRWVDVKEHNQKIDGKNLMHCIRLINVAKDIAIKKEIVVKRPEANYLLDIRKGKVDLDTLLNEANQKIKEMDKLFEESDLPNKPNKELAHMLLVAIREEIYKNISVR